MPDRKPCIKFEREEVHTPHRWSTPGKSFAAGASYHDCPGWNHKTKFACRFCQHSLGEHNLNVGCPHCACMATPGEGSPQTDRELDQRVLPPGATLPRYQKVKLMPRDSRFDHDPALKLAWEATETVNSLSDDAATVGVHVIHLKTLRAAVLAGLGKEPHFPGSVWAVVDRDHIESITSVHRTEIDALRVLNGRGYGRVIELPFGKSLADLVDQRG